MVQDWAMRFRRLLTDIFGRTALSHGYSSRSVERAEARLGIRLPAPLRDYYLTVGRHKINQAHNRLWPPEALMISQGRLVFMEENQEVVFWGVRSRSEAADPVVYQTTELDDGDWVSESRCSQFLPAMLCWQAVGGGLPNFGYSDPLASSVARRLTIGWSPAGRIIDLTAFVKTGRVLCAIREGKSVLLHVASRSRRDFQAMVSGFGVTIHEA
jgi:hypothetical protein